MSGPAAAGPLTWGDRAAIQLAMAGGIGKAPVSPGTFGSLPGVLLGGLLYNAAAWWLPSPAWQAVVTAAVLVGSFFLALWAIARTEQVLGIHDDQRIVLDEVVGQMIAVAFIPPAPASYVAAFLLFRLLDITKPSLIGRIDRDGPGAWGTLGDDILAGVIAGIIIWLVFPYGLGLVT